MKNIIIIGSGIGGLIAGNLLAKKGHKVTIFESHSRPGGYTAGFWRKGFYFESGTVSFEASATMFKTMKDIGVLDRITFIRKKERFISRQFDFVLDSYETFKKSMYKSFPEEKSSLDGYFAEMDFIYSAMKPFINKPIPYLFTGIQFYKSILSYVFRGRKYFDMMKKYQGRTVVDLADKYFRKGSILHRIFSDLGYPFMGIEGMTGLFLYIAEDYWTVVEGMQHLADVLAENFLSLGGELKLKSYVDRIITKIGRATGVSSKGNEFNADVVISASDYKNTFLKLIDDQSLISDELKERIRNASVSEGLFTVYLGLNLKNEELKEKMKNLSVVFNKFEHDIDYDNPDDAAHFEKAGLLLYSPSLVNPKLAPAGKSSLMIQSISPNKWQNSWHRDDKEKYRQLKAKVKEAIIERAHEIIPDLRYHIEFEEAATPLTYERYTHNTDGASSSWSWNPNRKFYDDPQKMHVETPVKNLYIGSCWAYQIGGIPGAICAAYMAARKAG
jgi:phytoene dehydrogenase-like protein